MLYQSGLPRQLSTTEKYKVTLIVLTKPRPNEYGTVDEIIYLENLDKLKAKQKMAEINERSNASEIKRKVLVVHEIEI